jgi:TetR/AcrR family transcriptional regulator, regulator of cefoperazone and chloramphenicol sensitivity
MGLKLHPAETRERILEAAADVFSEKGYRDATVREIVARAEANLAAVNYHFRDKDGLYAEVLERAMRDAHAKHSIDGGLPGDAPPEARLRAFVAGFLHRVTDPGLQSRVGRLMAREMVDPTSALDRLAERVIRPIYGRLVGLVREVSRMPISRAELAAKSILGQILFYKHCAPVIERIDGRAPRGSREIDALADHITRFSIGGIRA